MSLSYLEEMHKLMENVYNLSPVLPVHLVRPSGPGL